MRIYQRRERDNFEPITTVFEVSGNIIILLGSPLNKQLSVGLIKINYEEVVELPVDGPFLKVDGTPNMVKVPPVGDILGDKLTAYAPNTTGIPYFKKTQGGNDRDCSMEIIKQLYDIAQLFDEVPNLDITSKSFGRIAEVELSYRGLDNNPKLIFDDVRQTSLCLATRGAEGKGDFQINQFEVCRVAALNTNPLRNFLALGIVVHCHIH